MGHKNYFRPFVLSVCLVTCTLVVSVAPYWEGSFLCPLSFYAVEVRVEVFLQSTEGHRKPTYILHAHAAFHTLVTETPI